MPIAPPPTDEAPTDASTAPARRRPGGARPKRSPWRDYPSIVWMIAAIVVAFTHRWVPESTWLMIHMLMLGALSHAIVVWSRYFTDALTKVAATDEDRRAENRRIAGLQIGAVAVMVGYPTGLWPLTVAGAILVVLAVTRHGLALDAAVRRSLAPRFTVTIRYYLCAVGSLMVGAAIGAWLATLPAGDLHGRLLLAHTMANLLGWVGLTVAGTLVTFWPTLLRTRMDERAERLARQALPIFVAGLAVLVGAALAGIQALAFAGLALYAVALLWWGRALLRPLRAKPPREFAAASVLCAMPWFVAGIVLVGVLLLSGDGWAGVSARIMDVAAVFVVGFAAQLLTGATSYLIPTVLGGGPAAVRANLARFDRAGTFRLVLINGGLVLFLLPAPSWVLVLVSVVGLLALAAFVPIMVGVVVTTVRERRAMARARAEGGAPGEGGSPTATAASPAARPSLFSGRQLLAGLVVLALTVAGGVALDPAAAGLTSASTGSAAPATGETVRVEVSAQGMRFVPASVEVSAGDRVVVVLTNDDPAMAHDLRLGGRATERLVPGQSAELDLGVVTQSLEGWCTIAGHRQAGMTFDVVVAGSAGTEDGSTATGEDQTGGHAAHLGGSGQAPSSADRVLAVPDARIGRVVDPVLAPLPPADGPVTHEIDLDMTEEPLEVAPGVWQTRWTYDGEPVGPTLRGRVGDRFVVRLTNSGTMGHSLDFHASWLAPDEPMRTIQPGESLVYEFTAQRHGVWMYHCGTPPVSSHIAAGMAGAVVIEPREGFGEVDHEFVLVQSEVYMGNEGASPEEATETDGAKIAAKNPDFVVFNGVASQYLQEPLRVRVGETVRFFVSDVGPNNPVAFHIVGNQFDTVYQEGAYLLKDGRDAFGTENGGSQALALQASQGGFVEMTFPEAGTYTIVNHVFSDAEAGAIGHVVVSP